MEKTDIFVWEQGTDGAGASLAVRGLKARMKSPVGDWFLVGPKAEKSERLAYDLGMKLLTRPDDLGSLCSLAASHGTSPAVLLWSADAVLVADWQPWQQERARIWPTCPAALLRRIDLGSGAPHQWGDLQSWSTWPPEPPPANQVKTLGAEEFDKAVHGGPSWPFGPSVVILEKPRGRR